MLFFADFTDFAAGFFLIGILSSFKLVSKTEEILADYCQSARQL